MVLAHQGSDIEYKNFYCTRPHAKVLAQLLDRPVRWIDDVCGPTARQMIRELKDGEILLLDNVRYVSEEQTLFETRLHLTHEQQAKTLLVEKLRRWPICMCATRLLPRTAISRACAGLSRCFPRPWAACLKKSTA